MRTRRLLGLGISSLALVAGIAVPAQASSPDRSLSTAAAYEVTITKRTNDGDAGGSSGSIVVHEPGNYDNMYYSAQFWAKGEDFSLIDHISDGRRAEAVVIVYHPTTGEQLDVDRFSTGDMAHYKLGTPDGSGDIREGRKVTVRLRAEGLDWVEGTLRVTA